MDAAVREAWEEAGITVRVLRDLGGIYDMRSSGSLTQAAPRALYQFFEARVEKMEESWPEMYKRSRAWVSYAQAVQCFASRPELLEALNRSSIRR
jgi:diphosphoinositol-polyphosphate diphosphatase